MANGSEECCALGICCPPAAARRRDALAAIIEDLAGKETVTCLEAADAVLQKFDLAMKGTLQPLIDATVESYKHHAQH